MSFFTAPPEFEATIFTRMPERFRLPAPTPWGDANRDGQALDSFLEGPCFDRAGNLYVVDIPFGRIFRIDPAGDWTLVTQYDGWPNGLKIAANGTICIADYRRGLLQMNPDTGELRTVLVHVRSEGFRGLNDLVIGPSGDIYFTDQGQTGMHDPTGRVYRLSASGRLDCLLANGPSPNGIALNGEETCLYVAMTRAAQVWRIPLSAQFPAAKVGVFVQLPGGIGGPDGLAVDQEGGLAICVTGHGVVWMVDRYGQPTGCIRSPLGRSTTNLAYGGADRRLLHIVESATGTILRAAVPVAGLPLADHGFA